MAKTPKQGGTFIGGFHKLPKNKNRHALSTRRFGSQTKNLGVRTYQNEHYARAGSFGDKTHAQSFSRRYNKTRVVGAASTGAALGGLVAAHANHPGLAIAGGSAGIAGSVYTGYQQHKMRKQLNRDTKTRPSLIAGYRPAKRKK